MKVKILITGSAGFIGSNLCEYFLNKGYQVVGLDNLSTGKLSNLDSVINFSDFEFIEGDIRDLEICKTSVKDVKYVLHQAALGSVPRSVNDPLTTNDVNVSGFLNMLVASKDEGVNKFIYAASSSTYGDSEKLPKIEHEIGKPLSPYAITKYVNELYADVFYKTYGLNCIGLRYFNVFGRKQDPNGAYAAVIPKFTSLLMQKKAPVINGNGTYSRDFTYIDNVIEANEKALLCTDPRAVNQVFNVAYGSRTTISELVDLLINYLSDFDACIKEVKVEYGPERQGDVPHSKASIEKAREILNYNPLFDFKSGLKEAVKWYKDNL